MAPRGIERVTEGKIELLIPKHRLLTIPRKRGGVFYNPEKALDRDLSVIFLKAFRKRSGKNLRICDLLTASGVRGLRYACEVEGLESVTLNDANPEACKLAKQNLELNRTKVKCEVRIFKSGANKLLLTVRKFDFIDVDPFGSPNPFLDRSVRSLKRYGVLAITSTDTACLCGTYPTTCFRKYGAYSYKTEYYGEVGIRILAKKAIEIGAQYDLALEPLFGYFLGSCFRLFLQADIGAKRTHAVLREIGFILHCKSCLYRETAYYTADLDSTCPKCGSTLMRIGPLFLGKIWNEELCKEMFVNARENVKAILGTIFEECKIEAITYYTTNSLSKLLKKPEPKLEKILLAIRSKGFACSKTHFSAKGLRTTMGLDGIKEVFQTL
jgi:tRNA (guanine26-N2/guanine27-N2)-dimethyltransferase